MAKYNNLKQQCCCSKRRSRILNILILFVLPLLVVLCTIRSYWVATFVLIPALNDEYNKDNNENILFYRNNSIKLKRIDKGGTTTTRTTTSNSIANNNNNVGNNNTSKSEIQSNRIVHVGIYGLGHRLCRAAAVWHLAYKLNISQVKFQWGTCGVDINAGDSIFPYLFGTDTIQLPQQKQKQQFFSTEHSNNFATEILVRNDVYGYVPGQALKNFKVPINATYYNKKQPSGVFLSKMDLDNQFYSILMEKYQFKNHIQQFMTQEQFNNHVVLGLHLRIGNGEQTHFTDSGRNVYNEFEFVSNLLQSIKHMVSNFTLQGMLSNKPPLLFLATDTAHLIPFIQNQTESIINMKTIVLPQIRLKENQGVTFKALVGSGKACLDGWRAMVSDMLLLSHCDVIFASQRSSFTQTVPLSMVFSKNQNANINTLQKQQYNNNIPPRFCEVSESALQITCFYNRESWLFRDNHPPPDQKINKNDNENNNNNIITYSIDGNYTPVVHKLIVQFPDVQEPKEYFHAIQVLQNSSSVPLDQRPPPGSMFIHSYGSKRFYPKYRNPKKANDLVTTWNMQ